MCVRGASMTMVFFRLYFWNCSDSVAFLCFSFYRHICFYPCLVSVTNIIFNQHFIKTKTTRSNVIVPYNYWHIYHLNHIFILINTISGLVRNVINQIEITLKIWLENIEWPTFSKKGHGCKSTWDIIQFET